MATVSSSAQAQRVKQALLRRIWRQTDISNHHHHNNSKTIKNWENREFFSLFFCLLLTTPLISVQQQRHVLHPALSMQNAAPGTKGPHATSALCREGRGKRTSWNAADWPMPLVCVTSAHRTLAGSKSQMHAAHKWGCTAALSALLSSGLCWHRHSKCIYFLKRGKRKWKRNPQPTLSRLTNPQLHSSLKYLSEGQSWELPAFIPLSWNPLTRDEWVLAHLTRSFYGCGRACNLKSNSQLLDEGQSPLSPLPRDECG